MKKKSPRGVPDFSRQASRPKDAARPDAPAQTKDNTRAVAPAPRVKPPSTSAAKSGQRGQ
jgi:hypothetical protein